MEAEAADFLALDDGRAEPELRGANGGGIAPGAGADN
jgi:hypothetical protein